MSFRRNFLRVAATATTTSFLVLGSLTSSAHASASTMFSPQIMNEVAKTGFKPSSEVSNNSVNATAVGTSGTDANGDGGTPNSDITNYSLSTSGSNYVLGVTFVASNASFNTNWSTGGGVIWVIDADGNGTTDYVAGNAYSSDSGSVVTLIGSYDTNDVVSCSPETFAVSGQNMTLTFPQSCISLTWRAQIGVMSVYNDDPTQGVDNAYVSDMAPDDLTVITDGYWIVTSNGYTEANGAADDFPGLSSGLKLNKPIIAATASSDKKTLWMLGTDGGVFSFCDTSFYGYGDCGPRFYGSTGNIRLNKPAVSIESSRSGNGYWFVASDGGVFSYGDALYHGSMGGKPLNRPVVGMTRTPSGNGYWLVASDGGIFSFGDANFYGSTGAIRLNQPIIGMQRTPSGHGYWLFAKDGGIFSFGDAPFFGSVPGQGGSDFPVVSVAASRTGQGYTMLTSDGTIWAFGDGPAWNSLDNTSHPAVALVGK
jgi:hypothetical protein